MSSVLCFDIETVPDVSGLRRLWSLDADLDDQAVAQLAFTRRREQTGSDFLPLHHHRIVAIGCLFRDRDGVRVRCLGSVDDDESRLVGDFFKVIDRHTPQLVSWNGSGFDMQVLQYRALVHGVQASRYWELGEEDREFKWNNYISRYHQRHLDLMDLLAMYQPRGSAPLDQLARLMGLPGKLGMDGSAVWGAWLDGRIDEIRDYCETDVVNTHLVFLRFQMMRGLLTAAEHDSELALVKTSLAATGLPHWKEFIAAWEASC